MNAESRANITVEDDLGAIQRVLTTMSEHQIIHFLTQHQLPQEIILVGGDDLLKPLQAMGKSVSVASSVDAVDLRDGAVAIWSGKSFEQEDYPAARALRSRFPGRVHTVFDLLAGAALFQAVGHLVGYHVNEHKLTSLLAGLAQPMAGLSRLADSISGKRVIEFGPLDGAMTAGLVQLGAAEVACVDIRMVNAIKMLANIHTFAWKNVRLILEDMHMVDAAQYGRFDLVVAHGVYYHSAAPFAFLENICTLSDTIFLGGFCAAEGRLRVPLVELDYGGQTYRAQPYKDPLANDGAGVHPIGYYFLADDLQLWMERAGYSVEVLDLAETPPNKRAGLYLRAICRRRGPSSP